MRVLILSANTGRGHNSTAEAIAEQLRSMSVEYEIADTLAFISEKVSNLISRGHSYVYRRLPRLFGLGYRFEEKHAPRFIYEQCARGADALQEKLAEDGYDAVICVHVFAGLMLTEVRHKYHSTVPAYFVATDYTCSPGLAEMQLDGYFIPHSMLRGNFVRYGFLPADKIVVTGIPVRQEFCEHLDAREARRALELPEEGKIVLLSCGSMGCGKLEKSAMMLYRGMPKGSTLVVLCGKNEKTYEALAPHACENLRVLRFTDQIATYMAAADLYLTKPGGLTTSEAIAKELPMMLIDAVPGLETRNFNFLIANGVADGTKSWRELTMLVQKGLTDPSAFDAQREAMKTFTVKNAAELICRHVVKP